MNKGNKLKILIVASEAGPYVKSGGLGDVVGSLPKALIALGADVRIVRNFSEISIQSLAGECRRQVYCLRIPMCRHIS